MASLNGKRHNITMESKLYQVKAWVTMENGKLFKITSNENWKNVIPGDYIMLRFDFITGFGGYSNHREPKMNVTVYRYNKVLFTENAYFISVANMISHFELIEIDNKFIG